MPHNGHVLTRVMKDPVPRYRTMRGYDVPRKAGWDTHGLPVEVEVEKELGIHGKAAIETYGVEPFARKCIDSVFTYTERVGGAQPTASASGSTRRPRTSPTTAPTSRAWWWALSRLFSKGLLYQDYKVVWWWPQGGTALSSGEVGEGNKTGRPSVGDGALPGERPARNQFPGLDHHAVDASVERRARGEPRPRLRLRARTARPSPTTFVAEALPSRSRERSSAS